MLFIDESDAVYHSFQSKTTTGLEVGSLIAGGYGAVKGIIGFSKIAKMPVQVSRTSLLVYGEIIMKWQAKLDFLTSRHYEIKHDPLVGFYFYVFEDGKCIRDYLQDTLELAMECAWEGFGVPKETWEKIEAEN